MSDFLKRYKEIRGEAHVQSLVSEGLLAVQIKEKRKILNMSQQDLADQAGVPKSTIGRVEAGLTSPRAATLFRISKALNMPLIIDGTLEIQLESSSAD